MGYVEDFDEPRTTLEAVFTRLLGQGGDVRLRDRSPRNPVPADVWLGFFHERDEQIGGDGQVNFWPNLFVVGGDLDVGGGGACRVMGMGVVDHLQVESFVSNILFRNGKVLHIHHEGDLGPFGR